jgi:hypothetical protein
MKVKRRIKWNPKNIKESVKKKIFNLPGCKSILSSNIMYVDAQCVEYS